MSEPRTGSRYELQVTRRGTRESKAEQDYFAVHPGDVEEVKEEDDLVGYVHSYEVGSTVDGPGIRFVGFLTGCLLRCQFCHNPDTWHKHNGHPVTVSRAMQQIGKYAQVLKVSKGGITISGGDMAPALMPFVVGVLCAVVAYGRWQLAPHRSRQASAPVATLQPSVLRAAAS